MIPHFESNAEILTTPQTEQDVGEMTQLEAMIAELRDLRERVEKIEALSMGLTEILRPRSPTEISTSNASTIADMDSAVSSLESGVREIRETLARSQELVRELGREVLGEEQKIDVDQRIPWMLDPVPR